MAVETIREMAAKVGLDVDENAFEVFDGLLGTVKKGLGGLGIVLGAAAVGLAAMVGKTVETAGQLADLSARTGLEVDLLQRLGHAASLGGVGLEELAVALNFASKKGVKDLPKFIQDTADQVQKLNAEGKKSEAVALTMKRFGRSGAALLPILKDGGENLRDLMEEADQLGLVMGEDLVQAGDDLGDNFDRIKGAAMGVGRSLAAEVIPALLELTNDALAWWRANRRSVIAGVISGFNALRKVVQALGVVVRFVAESWKAIAIILGSVVLAALIANGGAVLMVTAGYVGMGIAAVSAGLSAAAAWVAATWPALLLIGVIAGVLLVLEDLWTSLNGGEGMMMGLFEEWTKFWEGFLEDEPDDWPLVAGLKMVLRFLADIQGGFGKIYDSVIAPAGKWLDSLGMDSARVADPNAFTGMGGASSPAAAAALQTSATSVTTGRTVNMGGMTIVQQPGQNAEEVAGAVRRHVEEAMDARDRETEAALGPVP